MHGSLSLKGSRRHSVFLAVDGFLPALSGGRLGCLGYPVHGDKQAWREREREGGGERGRENIFVMYSVQVLRPQTAHKYS